MFAFGGYKIPHNAARYTVYFLLCPLARNRGKALKAHCCRLALLAFFWPDQPFFIIQQLVPCLCKGQITYRNIRFVQEAAKPHNTIPQHPVPQPVVFAIGRRFAFQIDKSFFPETLLDLGLLGRFEAFIHPHPLSISIRPAQGRFDTSRRGPRQMMQVGVKGHFFHIVRILPDDGTDQCHWDPR